MRWPWLGLAVFLFLGQGAWGGAFEDGLGSRALARGRVCVAWADEATAGSCNPAGPASLEGFHLLVGLAPRIGPAAELKLLSGATSWGTLALSGAWALSSSGIKTEELWASSLALRAGERLSLGIGVKRYHQSSGGTEAMLDLGVLYRAADLLTLGMDFGDVVHSGAPLVAPLTRVGVRLALGLFRGGGELALSPTAPLQGSLGIELALFAPLILRLGWAAGRWSGGLGLDSRTLRADFALRASEEGPVWMLSTEVVFCG